MAYVVQVLPWASFWKPRVPFYHKIKTPLPCRRVFILIDRGRGVSCAYLLKEALYVPLLRAVWPKARLPNHRVHAPAPPPSFRFEGTIRNLYAVLGRLSKCSTQTHLYSLPTIFWIVPHAQGSEWLACASSPTVRPTIFCAIHTKATPHTIQSTPQTDAVTGGLVVQDPSRAAGPVERPNPSALRGLFHESRRGPIPLADIQ